MVFPFATANKGKRIGQYIKKNGRREEEMKNHTHTETGNFQRDVKTIK